MILTAATPRRRASGSARSDPFAELARLIGQNDPFAELGRSNARGRARRRTPRRLRRADWRAAPARQPRFAAAKPFDAQATASEPAIVFRSPCRSSRRFDEPRLRRCRVRASSRPAYATRSLTMARMYDADQRRATMTHYGAHYAAAGASESGRLRRPITTKTAPPSRRTRRSTTTRRARGRRGISSPRWRLIGCAMFGTAGAYGYRDLLHSSARDRGRRR